MKSNRVIVAAGIAVVMLAGATRVQASPAVLQAAMLPEAIAAAVRAERGGDALRDLRRQSRKQYGQVDMRAFCRTPENTKSCCDAEKKGATLPKHKITWTNGKPVYFSNCQLWDLYVAAYVECVKRGDCSL